MPRPVSSHASLSRLVKAVRLYVRITLREPIALTCEKDTLFHLVREKHHHL